jgi:hypothetical protein
VSHASGSFAWQEPPSQLRTRSGRPKSDARIGNVLTFGPGRTLDVPQRSHPNRLWPAAAALCISRALKRGVRLRVLPDFRLPA